LKWVKPEAITYDNNMTWAKFQQSLVAALCAASLGLAPAQIGAQGSAPAAGANLPRLGDAGSEELTPAAERRIGEAIMRDIRREGASLEDIELHQMLNQFASRLTATSAASGFSFEFFFVPDASLNAFALPGGFIGVHTGLWAAAQSESEVASVLAHEIGHVTQRHIARMLSAQRQSSVWQIASLVLAALAARSNPNAAIGAITLGMGAQQDAMLSFSRDAEREADRTGLAILSEAGFEPTGMVAFFTRLQQATRLYESNAPGYLRTHPLTVERIADMQNRVRQERYRQRADSIEFRLSQARVRALLDPSADGLRRARQQIERQIKEQRSGDELAAWFALATLAIAQAEPQAAQRAFSEIAKRLPQSHPFIDRLHIEHRQLTGGPLAARDAAQSAMTKWPEALAIRVRYAQALLDTRQFQEARSFLEAQTQFTRTEPKVWELLAKAHAGLGNNGAAHQASAEQYALLGGWLGAIEQLQLARRSPDLDFFAGSKVDARLRELQAIYQQEQRERSQAR
jgi:predicted Zn-dependent protease